jgi:hypothetical protein
MAKPGIGRGRTFDREAQGSDASEVFPAGLLYATGGHRWNFVGGQLEKRGSLLGKGRIAAV